MGLIMKKRMQESSGKYLPMESNYKKRSNNSIVCMLMAFLIMTAAGCGGDYAAERHYWKISKKYSKVIQNPRAARESEFNEAIEALSKLIKNHPAWRKSSEIQFVIGQLYAARQNIQNARKEYQKVIENYPERKALGAKAQFNIGYTYEKENDWTNACLHYREAVERYPSTREGLYIPLYIARYYLKKGMMNESEKAYEKAIDGYMNMIERNPYSKLVTTLQDMIIAGYGEQLKWDQAVEYLRSEIVETSERTRVPILMYKTAKVYSEGLKQQEKALELYNQIIEQYPLTEQAKWAHMEAANIYSNIGNKKLACQEYKKIITMYRDDKDMCACAGLALAKEYENSSEWSRAMIEMQEISSRYPDTLQSMQVPLIAYQHYKNSSSETGKNAYREAMNRYGAILRTTNDKKIALYAKDSIATAHILGGRWTEAVDALKAVNNEYPADIRAASALFKMAVIYDWVLGDHKKAGELYKRFYEKYDSHKLAGIARKITESNRPVYHTNGNEDIKS